VRRLWGVLAGLLIAVAGTPYPGRAASTDAPQPLPLARVKAGMTGYGLTVVRGTAIERFDVRILGILKGGPVSDLILFRGSGPVIRAAGGTASGMSGSPIFIDGRIAGALSYGYHFAGLDADLSLATPIEEMLKLLVPVPPGGENGGTPRVFDAAVPLVTPAGRISRVLLMRSNADAQAYNAHPLPETVAVAPTAVPVFTGGVTAPAMALLARQLGRYNVVPTQGYGGKREFPPPPVEPGSSMGIELASGDIEVGAIGTVTYRRGTKILAFGHPLLNAGPAAMPLTAAWINTVVRSVDFPFKEGSVGAMVGVTTQDRASGMAGELGRFPRMFGVRVRVRDGDGPVRETAARVVARADLAELLVPVVALSAVQKALDRVAGGSARVRIALRARGLPREIAREDVAYDAADIATASVLDVPGATQLLFGNFFRTLVPVDMTIDIAVRNEANTALLVAAEPSTKTVTPGQRLQVRVALFPYGGRTARARTVQFTVPRDFPPGPAFLIVGSAGALNDVPLPTDQKFQLLVSQQGVPPNTAESLDDAVDQFEGFGKNTEVAVYLVPSPVLQAVGGNANPGSGASAGTFLSTDAVVLGKFQIPLVVK
jgi:SpoIVB peptidase S55